MSEVSERVRIGNVVRGLVERIEREDEARRTYRQQGRTAGYEFVAGRAEGLRDACAAINGAFPGCMDEAAAAETASTPEEVQ